MTHGYLILLMINLGFMFPKVIYSWIIISSNVLVILLMKFLVTLAFLRMLYYMIDCHICLSSIYSAIVKYKPCTTYVRCLTTPTVRFLYSEICT